MTPHTQGPWTVAGEGFVVGGEGDAPNADFVSLTHITAPSCATNYLPVDGEREANARLMAAAPDLLSAVKKLRRVVDLGGLDPVDGDYCSILEQADLAIAKAEGR
jgi:hypothetical protein